MSLPILRSTLPLSANPSMLKSSSSVTQVRSETVTPQSSIAIPLTSPVNLTSSSKRSTEETVKSLRRIQNSSRPPTVPSSNLNQPSQCALRPSLTSHHSVDSLLEI